MPESATTDVDLKSQLDKLNRRYASERLRLIAAYQDQKLHRIVRIHLVGGGVITAAIRDMGDGGALVGLSLCSPWDEFDRKRGIQVAINRCNMGPSRNFCKSVPWDWKSNFFPQVLNLLNNWGKAVVKQGKDKGKEKDILPKWAIIGTPLYSGKETEKLWNKHFSGMSVEDVSLMLLRMDL